MRRHSENAIATIPTLAKVSCRPSSWLPANVAHSGSSGGGVAVALGRAAVAGI